MPLKKKDFIEIEFTAKTKEGQVFDSNIFSELQKINPQSSENIKQAKPFIFALGEGMFLQGVDNFLIGKEPNKKYTIELPPGKAFGLRDPKLVQLISMRVFRENKLNPVPGLMINLDGRIAKILSVSGGRVMVDFNHPIAGKTVIYEINVLRKVEDLNEKINAFNDFLFKKNFKFEVKSEGKTKKIILEVEKEMAKFVEMFEEKFKEILGMGLEVREVGKKVEKKEENS